MAEPKKPDTKSIYAPIGEVDIIQATEGQEKKKLGESYKDLIADKKKAFLKERVEQILSGGGPISPASAASQASKEFDETFLLPLTNTYADTLGEATFNLIGPDMFRPQAPINLPPPKGPTGEPKEPTLFGAISPQTMVSETVKGFKEAAPPKVQEPDWTTIKNTFIEEEGLDPVIADTQTSAIRAAYDAQKKVKPNLSYQDIFKQTIEQLDTLPTTMKGEGETLEEAPSGGPAVPLYQAFSKQKVAGKVPDLSPPQLAYFDLIYNERRKTIEKNVRDELSKTGVPYVRLSDGQEIPADVWGAMKVGGMPIDMAPLEASAKPFTKIGATLSKEEIKGRVDQRIVEEAPEIWWADPKKRSKVLADPEAFFKKGILTSETPFGGTSETATGWLLRSAMTVPNLVAGTVYEYGAVPTIEALGGTGLGEKRAASRKEKTPGYADSPILLNVAEGRGYTGEQQEAGQLLELGTPGRVAMTAAGFAADLLDPTLGAIAGVAKGAKGGVQTYKLSRALYSEPKMASLLRAGKVAGISGATEFLNDFNGITLITDLASKAGATKGLERLAIGDIRTHMGADLTGSLIARDLVKEGLKSGKTVEQIIEDLAPYAKTTYGKTFSKNLSEAGEDVGAAFDASEDLITAKRGTKDIGEGGELERGYTTLLNEHDASIASIDNISEGRLLPVDTSGIRAKDLARSLGSLAKTDEYIADIFRAVDAAPASGVPKIYQYVEALKTAGKLGELKKILTYNKALTQIYRDSEKMAGLDNLIAITKNTFADKARAGEILDSVKTSSVGKIVQGIIDDGVAIKFGDVSAGFSTRSTISPRTEGAKAGRPDIVSPEAVPYYDLKGKQGLISALEKEIAEQVTFGKLKSNIAARMRDNLKYGRLTTKDLRRLIDNTIDLTAEAVFAEGVPGARARDLARTTTAQQMFSLDPLEFRSFGRSIFKQFIEDNFFTKARSRGLVSPQQRRIIRDVEQRASAMDVDLRKKISSLLGKDPTLAKGLAGAILGFFAGGKYGAVGGGLAYAGISKLLARGEKEVAALLKQLYGLDPAKVYNNNEILGALIVGPRPTGVPEGALVSRTGNYGSVQRQNIQETMFWAVRRLFFTEKTTESIVDRLLGLNKLFENKIFSTKGTQRLETLVFDAAERAMKAPDTYWTEVSNLIRDARALIESPENLLSGVNKSDIVDVVSKNKGKIPPEVQIGAYYQAENQRIMESAVSSLLDEDETLGALKYKDGMDPDFAKGMEDFLKDEFDIDPENMNDLYVGLIKERAVLIASGGKTEADFSSFITSILEKTEIYNKDLEDIAKALNSIDPTDEAAAAQLAKLIEANKPAMIYLAELSKQIDASAETILRKNGLELNTGAGNVVKLRGEIEALFDQKYEGAMKALLGKDVYDEILSSVIRGKMKGFDAYIDKSIREATGSASRLQKTLDFLSTLVQTMNTIRYTLLLGIRPRFHGPNILMANAITYSTVGRFAGGPLDIKALQIIRNGSNWGSPEYYQLAGFFGPQKTPYTYGEIYDTVISSGVRSEAGFITQVDNQSAIVNFFERSNLIENLDLAGLKAKGASLIEEAKKVRSLSGGLELLKSAKKPADDVLYNTLDALTALTTAEDLTFRIGIARGALNEGRTLDEAVELAKRSLFDYADMFPAEKAIQSYLMFYAFTRQNFITLLRAFGDVDKFKRFERTLKVVRGGEALSEDFSEKNFNAKHFLPEYTLNRSLFDFSEGASGDTYIAGPPMPALDSVNLLAKIISGQGSDVLLKMLHPTWAYSLDLESVEVSKKQITPEHIWLSSAGLTDNPTDLANYWEASLSLFGGKGEIIPVEDPTAPGGFSYPLPEGQKEAYNKFNKYVINFSGLGAVTSDAAKVMGRKGMTTEKLGPIERVAFGVGAITPMKVKRPEAQETSQIRARIKAIDDQIYALKGSTKPRELEAALEAVRAAKIEEDRKKLGLE